MKKQMDMELAREDIFVLSYLPNYGVFKYSEMSNQTSGHPPYKTLQLP